MKKIKLILWFMFMFYLPILSLGFIMPAIFSMNSIFMLAILPLYAAGWIVLQWIAISNFVSALENVVNERILKNAKD